MNAVLTFTQAPALDRPRRAAFVRAGLGRWWTHAVTRAELRRLLATGHHLVEDIGLDVAWARAEAAKPFWRS